MPSERIGIYIMLTFQEVNNLYLACTKGNVLNIGLVAADKSMDYEALLAWVREHRV